MTSDSDDCLYLIYDDGSALQKAGISGEEAPQVCRYISPGSPFKNGLVQDWARLEAEWRKTCDENLKITVDSREDEADVNGVMLLRRGLTPSSENAKVYETWFESFGTRRCNIEHGCKTSLYSNGRTTGLCLDVGFSTMDALCIYEGYKASPIRRDAFGLGDLFDTQGTVSRSFGNDPSEMTFSNMLAEAGLNLQLPDGFHCSTGGFKPSSALVDPARYWDSPQQAFGKTAIRGARGLIHEQIMAAPLDCRQDLLTTIVISGGCADNSFVEDMRGSFPELPAYTPGDWRAGISSKKGMKFIAPPHRQICAWLGGSILASLSTFHRGIGLDCGITVDDWNEIGSRAAVEYHMNETDYCEPEATGREICGLGLLLDNGLSATRSLQCTKLHTQDPLWTAQLAGTSLHRVDTAEKAFECNGVHEPIGVQDTTGVRLARFDRLERPPVDSVLPGCQVIEIDDSSTLLDRWQRVIVGCGPTEIITNSNQEGALGRDIESIKAKLAESQSGAGLPNDLIQLLVQAKLDTDDVKNSLKQLGVNETEDLQFLTAEDFAEVGLSRVQHRRLQHRRL